MCFNQANQQNLTDDRLVHRCLLGAVVIALCRCKTMNLKLVPLGLEAAQF